MFIALRNFLLDLIFPVRCTGCGREGEWLCASCAENIELNQKQYCPVCWRKSERGATCTDCHSPLTGLYVAASYRSNPELAKAVKQLKYKFSESLAKHLGKLLAQDFLREADSVIIPIPLHRKRLRWRGFNQAELLAREVSEQLGLPLEDVLTRTKDTSQQAKLSREERLQNLEQAFALRPDAPELKGKNVILVDDVASTGTTLVEAAKALRVAGVAQVWGLVLARR